MKYVVIFKAIIRKFDSEYDETAIKLRDKALSKFNCQKFESFCSDQNEIALSYWNNLADIQAWHLYTEHQIAQQLGKEKWYKYFSIEICEIHKHYAQSFNENHLL